MHGTIKFIFGLLIPILSAMALIDFFLPFRIIICAVLLVWLYSGAAVLYVRCNFPHVIFKHLPSEPFLKGLAIFASWLLWPLWVAQIPRQP